MLKINNKYLLKKPLDVNESPCWLTGMDKYNNKIVTIHRYNSNNNLHIKDDNGRYVYNERWFHPVESKKQLFIKSLCLK